MTLSLDDLAIEISAQSCRRETDSQGEALERVVFCPTMWVKVGPFMGLDGRVSLPACQEVRYEGRAL